MYENGRVEIMYEKSFQEKSYNLSQI